MSEVLAFLRSSLITLLMQRVVRGSKTPRRSSYHVTAVFELRDVAPQFGGFGCLAGRCRDGRVRQGGRRVCEGIW